MGLLDYFRFGSKKVETTTPKSGHQAFSTPFMTVGEGNLSMPFVSTWYTQNNVVRFGTDNLYPQLLNQLYYQSPIHGQAIDFITNAIIGGGLEWVDKSLSAADAVDLMAFEKTNGFKKMAKLLTRDWTMHRRVTVLVKKKGKSICLYRLDPATIRNGVDLQHFVYSEDWSRGAINSCTYKRYYPGCSHTESLYIYQDETPGTDVYPIPAYNSILNFAYLDGEQSYYHKAHIQNSIFPSIVIRRPKEFGSIDEVQKFREEIVHKQGAGNAGRVMVLTGNGMDDVPEVNNFAPAGFSFAETAREIKDQICFAHGINPSIMGIKVAGSLGATTELQDSYAIFEKNRVMPERDSMSEILNELIDACGIPNTIAIKNFQIIEREVKEATPNVELKIGK